MDSKNNWLDNKTIEYLGDILINEDDEMIHWGAAYVLSRSRDTNAVEPLIHALEKGMWDTQAFAAYALGEIADPRAVIPLVENGDSTNDIVRIHALTKIGVPALKLLINIIENDSSHWSRLTAVEALGQIGIKFGSERIKKYLLHVLPAKESNQELQDFHLIIMRILSGFKDRMVTKEIINYLKNDKEHVKGDIIELLGDIGDKGAVKPIIRLLNDKEEYTRIKAAKALGILGNRKAIKPLLNSLQNNNFDDTYQYEVCIESASALTKFGEKKGIAFLINALGDSRSFVRSKACHALGMLRNKKIAIKLINMLNDEEDYVRASAAEALGEIGCKEAVMPLIKALDDDNIYVRTSSACSLGLLGEKICIKFLIDAARDFKSRIWEQDDNLLKRIILKMKDPELARLLDRDMRAESALSDIGDARKVLELLQAIHKGKKRAAKKNIEAIKDIWKKIYNEINCKFQVPYVDFGDDD